MIDIFEETEEENTSEHSRTKLRRLIAFTLGEGIYGLPITDVAEIREMLPITPLPAKGSPTWILGLINLRGMILPVVDIHQRLKPVAGRREESAGQLVIVKSPEYWLALRVDSIYGMVRLEPSEFKPAPSNTEESEFLSQVAMLDGQLLIELNTSKILEALPAHRGVQ
jgi:purine-binding chemotaxis protein CheW